MKFQLYFCFLFAFSIHIQIQELKRNSGEILNSILNFVQADWLIIWLDRSVGRTFVFHVGDVSLNPTGDEYLTPSEGVKLGTFQLGP